MEKKVVFSDILHASVKELKESLCAEKDALVRIRFAKKLGDSRGYESKFVRKKIARIQTALSMKRGGKKQCQGVC